MAVFNVTEQDRKHAFSSGTQCHHLKGMSFGLWSGELFKNDTRVALKKGENISYIYHKYQKYHICHMYISTWRDLKNISEISTIE